MYIEKSPQKQLKHEAPHTLLVSQISWCSSKSSFKTHACGTCCIIFQISGAAHLLRCSATTGCWGPPSPAAPWSSIHPASSSLCSTIAKQLFDFVLAIRMNVLLPSELKTSSHPHNHISLCHIVLLLKILLVSEVKSLGFALAKVMI